MLKQRPFLIETLTAIGLIVAPFVLPHLGFAPNTVNRILVWGLFGLGFDILFGFTGLLSFGQSAFYGTGGFAYGDVNNTMLNISRTGAPGYAGSQDTLRTGYAYGGGVEYALASNSAFNIFKAGGVTVKAEYIHYDLGTSSFVSNNVPGVAPAGSAFTNSVHTDGDLVRAGLNYKFSGPLFAKY